MNPESCPKYTVFCLLIEREVHLPCKTNSEQGLETYRQCPVYRGLLNYRRGLRNYFKLVYLAERAEAIRNGHVL